MPRRAKSASTVPVEPVALLPPTREELDFPDGLEEYGNLADYDHDD